MKGKLSNTDNHMNTLGYSDEEFNRIVSDQPEPDDGELKKVALEQAEFDGEQTSTRKKEIKEKRPFRKVIAAVLATVTVAGASVGIKKYNDYEKFVNDPVNKIKATEEYKQFDSKYGLKYTDPLSAFNAVEGDRSGAIAREVISTDEAKSFNPNEASNKYNFVIQDKEIGKDYNTKDAVKFFNEKTAPVLDIYLNAIGKNPDCAKIVDQEFKVCFGGGQSNSSMDQKCSGYTDNLMNTMKSVVSEYGANSNFTVQNAVNVADLPSNSFGQNNENCNSSVCSMGYLTTDKSDGGYDVHIDQLDQIVIKVDTYKDDGSEATTYKKIGRSQMVFTMSDTEKSVGSYGWTMGVAEG